MDFAATQVYEEEDFMPTQKISHILEEEELQQVGVLIINSIEYQIKKGTTKIGRLSSCDIVLNDATVSKMHAEIEASADQRSTWICDLNSSNKTKLNNLILRPTRSYELKNESVIEFGKVHAVYRTYHSTDDTMIPETPAPIRQKVTGTVIPNTPDSFFNNSSDGSVILGTQKDEENSVFRRPLAPRQCQSTSTDKKNISNISSVNESDDSQIGTVLHVSNTDVSENHETSIFDMETQKSEERNKGIASISIHDMETQKFLTDTSAHSKDENKTNKQLSKLDTRDKTAESSAINIHDMETQMIDDVKQCQKGDADSQDVVVNVIVKASSMDIRNLEMQNHIDDAARDSSESQSETVNNKVETKDINQIGHNVRHSVTQKINDKQITEDISEMETQLGFDSTNENKDKRNNKNIDRDNISNSIKNETNCKNIATSSTSRSSSPSSLNISSPGIDEEYASSPLNQSSHLLESTELLEYFGEGIGKEGEIASHASTPKPHSKISEREDNKRNMSNVSDEDDNISNNDNIFDAPTQRVNYEFEILSSDSDSSEGNALIICKSSKEENKKSQLKQINDDSETDAEEYFEELARKQNESSKTSDKSCNKSIENKNDLGTSVESEDMFDALTQRMNDVVKDTSNSSIKLSKTNKSDTVNDMALLENVGNIKNKCDNQLDTLSANNDTAPTQIILSHETSSKISSKDLLQNNQNDTDDMAPTQVINISNNVSKSLDPCMPQDLDHEDIDYEMAPTQVINDVENYVENKEKKKSTKKNSNRKKAKFSKVDLNDTLERNLNDMFDDVNNDSIDEPPHISTQCLEDILESSQCNDDLSANEATTSDDVPTDNTSQIQLRKKNRESHDQTSHNLPDAEANKDNANMVETDSQNSDVYFSTMTTKRKRNIIKDTQEPTGSMNIISPHQDVTSPRKLKQKTENDKIRSNKKGKRSLKAKTKSDVTMNNIIENESKTISSENNKKNATKMSEQALSRNLSKFKIDDAEKDLAINSNICLSCPSDNGQHAQVLNPLYENDDDILTRLPAVRISGTLSNPPSPSVSSTIRNIKSKRNTASSKKDIKSLNSKSKSRSKSRKQDVKEKNEDPKQINNKSSVPLSNNQLSAILKADKISEITSTSEESDNEVNYKRFKQMAERMLSNELKNTNKSAEKKQNTLSLADASKDSKQSVSVEKSNDLLQTSARVTRQSNKQNDKNSQIRAKSLNTIKEDVEQTNLRKKRKVDQVIEEHPILKRGRRAKIVTDRQSLNIHEYVAETSSRANSPIIENTKSLENDEATSKIAPRMTQKACLRPKMNKDCEKSNIKRNRRKINNQDTTSINDDLTAENNDKDKGTEENLMQIKVAKVMLYPLEDESQEVAMIMEKSPSNVQDKNSSIREKSNIRILQRGSRSTRNRKPLNRSKNIEASSASAETGSENSMSFSDIGDSDNSQSANNMPKAKRGRIAKNLVLSQQKTQVSEKKNTFKKPAHMNQNSAYSTPDSATENSINADSRNNENDLAVPSSRFSRSRAAGVKMKKKNVEMNQNTSRKKTTDESISSELDMNTEITSLSSTPSRIRRSMSSSILSNSSQSATRHRILFTGITEDKYNKLIKTLGGNKVEDPAKCTILVTDKIRRTYKFLCALARGIPIVAIDWLKDSESAMQFLDWENYILKDPVAEAKFGFRLRKSLDKAREKKLLEDYTIILTPNVAPPPIEELKDMVTSCGGKALLRPPIKWPEKVMILSREEDLSSAKKFLAKAPKTVTVQSTEFILTGILRQEIDLDKYKLT